MPTLIEDFVYHFPLSYAGSLPEIEIEGVPYIPLIAIQITEELAQMRKAANQENPQWSAVDVKPGWFVTYEPKDSAPALMFGALQTL